MSQAKCWRCAKRKDESCFDPGYKCCKPCLEKRRTYKSANAAQIREKQKEHYEANKEHVKQNREDHKEHIKAYRTEKINCPLCNCMVARSGLREHQLTRTCNKNNITTQAA